MLEGLLITLVGMAVVFVVLAILMYVIVGLERLFREREVARVVSGKIGVTEALPQTPEAAATPESTVEVAAIAVALASYLKERGRKLGSSLSIGSEHYHVQMGDPSTPPVDLMVNQEHYRAAIGEEGLPLAEQATSTVPRAKDTQSSDTGWRSAYSPQGGFWCRRGWTGREAKDYSRDRSF